MDTGHKSLPGVQSAYLSNSLAMVNCVSSLYSCIC